MISPIKEGQPKYWKLKMNLIEKIRSGELKDSSFLPSESVLMKEYSVSRNTVRNALAELEKEGILDKRQGQQSRINAKALQENQSSSSLRIAWLGGEGITEQVYFELFQEVSTYAAEKDLRLDYISATNSKALEMFLERQSSYTGVLYSSVDQMKLSKSNWDRVHTLSNLVGVDLKKERLGESYVSTDHAAGFAEATQYLIDTGHRHILYIGSSNTYYSFLPFLLRQQAFRDTLMKNGIPLDSQYELVTTDPKDAYDIRPLLESHIRKLPRLDAILAVADGLAVQCIYALKFMGINVPLDVSVVGFDGLWQGEQVIPSLTTVRQPTGRIAREAVDMVLRRAGKKNLPPEQLLIEPEMILRDSVFTRTQNFVNGQP